QGGKLVRIIDTKTGKQVTLKSGEYELMLKDQPETLKLSLEKVTLKRGDTKLVTVERVEKPVSDKGELVIRTEGEEVKVVIKQGGKEDRTIDTKTDKQVTLKSGDYELMLKDQPEGLKLSPEKVTLKRGDTVLVTIKRVDKPVPEKVGEVR